jgi:TIR domain
MRVFISWSGDRGRAAADALAGWLPQVINALKPWVSTSGIEKGARWSAEVAAKLEESRAGIVCLTPNSLHADWILFEAGALAKTVANTYVCTFLIGMEPSDVAGPLAQFQATKAMKPDVLRLVKTLNGALGEGALSESHVATAFEKWWPDLEKQISTLPAETATHPSARTDRDLLNEILETIRNFSRSAVSAISPQDRDTIVQARAWKAARSVWPGAGGSWSGGALIGDSKQYQMNVSRGGGHKVIALTIKIPSNATPDEIEDIVLGQLFRAKTEEEVHQAGRDALIRETPQP